MHFTVMHHVSINGVLLIHYRFYSNRGLIQSDLYGRSLLLRMHPKHIELKVNEIHQLKTISGSSAVRQEQESDAITKPDITFFPVFVWVTAHGSLRLLFLKGEEPDVLVCCCSSSISKFWCVVCVWDAILLTTVMIIWVTLDFLVALISLMNPCPAHVTPTTMIRRPYTDILMWSLTEALDM